MQSTHLGIQELRETVLFVWGLVWTLASLLFFFFCSVESFLLTNEPASVAHIFKKILLRPHITSSF